MGFYSRRQLLKVAGLSLLGRILVSCGGGGGVGGSVVSSSGGSSSSSSGGSSSSSSSGTGLTNPQPVPSGPQSSASVTVSSSTKVGELDPAFMGLSYEKSIMSSSLLSGSNAELIGLFKALGTQGILRIGGNSVDRTNWNASGSGSTSGTVAPADIQRVADFVQACGWRVLYGVNFGQSTAAVAADEVSHAVALFGASLAGIEIGNEPDLYVNRGYFTKANWNTADFISRWASFASAIRQVNSHVPITGPALAAPGNIASWATPFVSAESSQLSLVTQHYYKSNGTDKGTTVENMVLPDDYLSSFLPTLKTASAGLPYRMSETNSYFSGGVAGLSDSCASALWVIDHVLTIAEGGAIGVNMHGGGNSGGYTPIANSGSTVQEVRPEFYGLYFFGKLLGSTGGDLYQTDVTVTGGLNVTAYALRSSSGALRIAVINKDTSHVLNLTVHCGQSVRSATLMQMTMPSLDALSGMAWQGGTIGLDGSITPQAAYTLTPNGQVVTAYVEPASAALIQVG